MSMASVKHTIETRGPFSLIIGIVSTALALLLLAFRLWARFRVLKSPGWDDYLAIAGAVFMIGHLVVTQLNLRAFQGNRHLSDVDLSMAVPFAKTFYAMTIIYTAASSTIKASILVFYLRTLKGEHNRHYRLIIKLFLVFMILVSLTNGMLFALGCIPPQALWDPKYYMLRLTGKLQCINTRAAGFFGLGSSLAFDLAVTCFPLLYIHKMQLESHHKWWLSCFFSLGFFCSAANIPRLIYHSRNTSLARMVWTSAELYTWGYLELSAGLCAACGPGCYSFWREYGCRGEIIIFKLASTLKTMMGHPQRSSPVAVVQQPPAPVGRSVDVEKLATGKPDIYFLPSNVFIRSGNSNAGSTTTTTTDTSSNAYGNVSRLYDSEPG